RVAILARGGELRFLVHRASDGGAQVQAQADRAGAEVLATHLEDKQEILDFVAARGRDVGGGAGPPPAFAQARFRRFLARQANRRLPPAGLLVACPYNWPDGHIPYLTAPPPGTTTYSI